MAIARALVNDPVLIMADEPTGNLDTRTGEEIMAVLHDLHRRGRTIVMVTHEPYIAAQTERTIQLHDGKVVADGRNGVMTTVASQADAGRRPTGSRADRRAPC